MEFRPTNQRIETAGEDAVRILREIELVRVSRHDLGSFYAVPEGIKFEKENYDRETTRFIDEWKVTARLASPKQEGCCLVVSTVFWDKTIWMTWKGKCSLLTIGQDRAVARKNTGKNPEASG